MATGGSVVLDIVLLVAVKVVAGEEVVNVTEVAVAAVVGTRPRTVMK